MSRCSVRKTKAILTLMAGFVGMMYNGGQFLVNNIAPYIQSYFAEATTRDVQALMPGLVIIGTAANFVGA